MTDEEINKTLETMSKLGLVEKRVRNGVPEFRLTELGRDYAKLEFKNERR